MEALRAAPVRLLLVCPDHDIARQVAVESARLGYDVTPAADQGEALAAASTGPAYPVILVGSGDSADLCTPVLEIVAALRRASSMSQIVLLVPTATDVESCCRAIEAGVTGFVEMDRGTVDPNVLSRRLTEAVQRHQRRVEDAESMHAAPPSDTTPFVAQSRLMAEVLAGAVRAAQVSDAPVLIHGESGTGKQLLAEMIHRLDAKRRGYPFLTVNCAAITGTLAESELFGHIKGAFTGATQPRAGYFRSADKGTILLDEIGELDQAIQPKLLRVLQNGMILPVGADVEQPVDVRVLAATNRSLPELVEENRFRLDLYQRLNVISLEIPPLRERPEDIQALLPFFVRKYGRYYGREIRHIDRRVYEFLSNSALDGNVRELENTVRRILALKTSGDEILLTDIPESVRRSRQAPQRELVTREVIENACRLIEQGRVTLPEFVAECEKQLLAAAIAQSETPAGVLAERLGLSRRTFYNKRRKYGL